jgi:hypothetical protein
MKIAFTGTRDGMTGNQRATVGKLLYGFGMFKVEAHHGDCVGADADFHDLAIQFNVDLIVVHPPSDDKLRAWCVSTQQVNLFPLPYLERNKAIVNEADLLIATPKEHSEPPSGRRGQGTWWTIRYGRHVEVPQVIVWPDGSIT